MWHRSGAVACRSVAPSCCGQPRMEGALRYDAIVVGAGPAGCAAAFDLAARGRAVLLLDKRRFPRPKPCAGGVTIKAMRALRYPIDPVIRAVCGDFVAGNGLGPTRTLRGEHPVCAMTVRAEFDDFCLRQTIARGATFEVTRGVTGCTATAEGVRIEAGEVVHEASYVVAADGANSRMRRLVTGRALHRTGFAIEGIAPRDPDADPLMQFDFGAVDRGYGWLFSKGDHVNIGLYTSDPARRIGRAELAAYAQARTGSPALDDVMGHAIGLGGTRERCVAGRVLFAGDAAGLVDPLLGEGIHNAIVSGQAAAQVIDRALHGDARLERHTRRAFAPILRDLRVGERAARTFYARSGAGFRTLTSAPVARLLMGGAARGLTLDRTLRWNIGLFLLPVPRLAALQRNA